MSIEYMNTTSLFFKAAASYFGIPYDQLKLGGQGGDIAGTMNVRFEIMLTPDDLVGIAARMVEQADPESQMDKLVGIGDPEHGTVGASAEGWRGVWLRAYELPPHQRVDCQWPVSNNLVLVPFDQMTPQQAMGRPKAHEQFEPEGLAGMEWKMVKENVGDVIRNPEAFFGKPEYAQLVERACKLNKAVREKHTEWAQDQARMAIGGLPAESEGVGGRKVVHVDVPEQQDADIELPAAVWVPAWDASAEQIATRSDYRYRLDGAEGCDYLLQVALLTPEQKAKYCPEEPLA